MRDVALLALLYGVSEISKVFNLEEKVILMWMQNLKQDPFFKTLRKKIMDLSRDKDPSVVSRKYSISQNVISQVISQRDNANNRPNPDGIAMSADEEFKSTRVEAFSSATKKSKEVTAEICDLQMDEWFPSSEEFIVNISNFLTNLNASSHKPCKRVKLTTKEAVIAEVIREGTPLYRETALKFGLKPDQVKEWVQSYQSDGVIKENTCSIRIASSVLQQAYSQLLSES